MKFDVVCPLLTAGDAVRKKNIFKSNIDNKMSLNFYMDQKSFQGQLSIKKFLIETKIATFSSLYTYS